MPPQRYSRQREAILDYLRDTKVHPTADVVYDKVRVEYPSISLATVYRNLRLLSEDGTILRLNCGDGCERFDGNSHPHYHFICKECHRVYDLDMKPIEHIDVLASANFKGKVEGHKAYFYGVCEECIKKKEKVKKTVDKND